MKIVMLCDFYNENLEYQENLLVKYYRKHGHDVTVIASTYESVFDYYNDRHDNRAPARSYFHDGAKIIKLRYRYNIRNRLRAYTSISPILEEEQPDLIFVHDIMLNMPEAVSYKRGHPECRMIMDYHADYSNSGKNWLSLAVLHGVIRKWFLDRARPHLSRIFPIVPASAIFLNEIYDVPMSEMELLPLGADTDLARAVRQSDARKRLRQELGIPDEHIVIFTGGKLAPPKRTELLFQALSQLSDPCLHAIVVGEASEQDADYKRMLLELAEHCGRILFVGWLGREEIYRHMAAADLAIFPASQSILWQQAISMGLPLIVGDAGHQDFSYLNLERNIAMLASDEIRSDKLGEVIRSVIADPGLMETMRTGATKVAEEHLNWDKLIQRTLRFNETEDHRVNGVREKGSTQVA